MPSFPSHERLSLTQVLLVYFDTRPLGSRIGAWASPQSQMISNRNELDTRVAEIKDKFNVTDENDKEKKIPVPPYWGGLRIVPYKVEFWSGRNNRLHDRLVMTRDADTIGDETSGKWHLERLAP